MGAIVAASLPARHERQMNAACAQVHEAVRRGSCRRHDRFSAGALNDGTAAPVVPPQPKES
jgi:hypothetical protein